MDTKGLGAGLYTPRELFVFPRGERSLEDWVRGVTVDLIRLVRGFASMQCMPPGRWYDFTRNPLSTDPKELLHLIIKTKLQCVFAQNFGEGVTADGYVINLAQYALMLREWRGAEAVALETVEKAFG